MEMVIQQFPPSRRIGLTGGIGMGKTTIANYLHQQYHLPIFDADIYARESVAVGSTVLNQLVDRYGTKILLADGTLHRQQLSEIIFHTPDERQWVEQRIHPYVYDRFCRDIHHFSNQPLHPDQTTPTMVLAIPLLFEAEMTNLVTEIWVVTCSRSQQIDRILRRNPNLTPEQIQARIDSQLPISQKIAKADVVLENTSTQKNLYRQIDRAMAMNSTSNIQNSEL